MFIIFSYLPHIWWVLFIYLSQSSNADTFHIVTSQDTPCPGEFSGVPCVSLQQYVSNPSISTGNITFLFQTGNHTLASAFSASSASSYTLTGEDVSIECVSSAAQWNFLSIQQVHIRGISFFRCRGGMTFRNIGMLTMESVKVQYSDNRVSRTPNAPIIINNVAQVYVTRSDYSNNYNFYYNVNGGVFNVRNSSMKISSSIFHNNSADYYGGVLYVYDNYLRGTYQNRITITNSTFTNNRVSYGSDGGAICIRHSRGTIYYSVVLSIINSLFNNNIAGSNGGAVYYYGDEEVTITHSMFTNSYAFGLYGGAIYSTSSVRVTLCNITGNTANRQGGAIYSSSSVSAENCNISSNRGGAIYSSFYVIINNCAISDNIAGTHGGAVYSRRSSVTVTNCNITGNTANLNGGAIYSQNLVTISHSTLSDNTAITQGGAIYSGSELICECCVFLNNSAADGGAVLVNDSSSFISCEFNNNTAQNFGGAIHITGTDSSTSVLDAIFVNNIAVTLGGGAIYSNSHYSNVSITSSTFTHNTASYCSVLDVDEYYHFNVSITDSVFTSNTATGTLVGGGVACVRNASVTIRGSAFRYNHALLHGGVFVMDESHVLVDESLFLNNSATANGGVFYTYLHPSAYEVRRSEFSYNSAGEDGGVLYIGLVKSRVTISQCVFTYNEASDRGGMAALIGSSLYVDVNRTHIFNNTARLGGIISACNSEVNVGAGELVKRADPVYSFCTLYDGDLINYNISTNINGITTPTSSRNARETYSCLVQGNISPTSTFLITSATLIISNKLSLSSQTRASSTIDYNNIMTDPTSQNKLSTTITVSSSSDLKVNIVMALLLLLYIIVMILAIISGVYFIRRVYQKHFQKLSSITLHEQGNNDYEHLMDEDKEKDVRENPFSF